MCVRCTCSLTLSLSKLFGDFWLLGLIHRIKMGWALVICSIRTCSEFLNWAPTVNFLSKVSFAIFLGCKHLKIHQHIYNIFTSDSPLCNTSIQRYLNDITFFPTNSCICKKMFQSLCLSISIFIRIKSSFENQCFIQNTALSYVISS